MGKPPPDRWDRDEWGGMMFLLASCLQIHEQFLSGYPGGPGKYNSPLGGFINGIDQFDPLEFGISMKEAQHLDPSSRLILEVAHQVNISSFSLLSAIYLCPAGSRRLWTRLQEFPHWSLCCTTFVVRQ